MGVLGVLLREKSNWNSERGVAVNIPVIKNDQWRSALIFLSGLWWVHCIFVGAVHWCGFRTFSMNSEGVWA